MAGTSAPIFLADAFTSQPCAGNAAAVVLLPDGAMSDIGRQKLAAEMAQSETAFLEPIEEDQGKDNVYSTASDFKLRWFTPTTEVPMCGHATFAAAAVLFSELQNKNATLNFHTQSGTLSVRQSAADGVGGPVTLKMQMSMPIAAPDDPLPLPFSLGVDSPQAQQLVKACVGDLKVEEVAYSGWNNLNYVVLSLAAGTTRRQLEDIRPDAQGMLAAAKMEHVHGVIVTCRGGPGGEHDFLSRFFAPWMGISEDPVTGSAHMVLGPFWERRLGGKGTSRGAATGMSKATVGAVQPLRARQCSPRGGELEVVVQHSIGNVLLSGSALVILKGTVLLPS